MPARFYRFGMLSDDDARDLATYSALEWDASDRELLAPLVDAAFVGAEEAEFDRVGGPIIEKLWQDGLAVQIEEAVKEGIQPELLEAARADLALGPRRSKLGRRYVEQGAGQLAFEEQGLICCLCCVEEGLGHVEPEKRPEVARRVARVATYVAAIPEEELRAAVAQAAMGETDTATIVATDERRLAVRAWLGRLGELGTVTSPKLSIELLELVAEPLPAVEEDEIWRETVAGLTASISHSWN